MMQTLSKRLSEIQKELKAPKGQFNSFANFNYRSCEDILEAVKPLLKELVIVINDEMVQLGDRFYVKATVILSDGTDSITSTAYAREALDKKGMDDAQITGATSSYARKYALNGLFAIDDTKDADTQDNTKKPAIAPVKKVFKPESNPKTPIADTAKPSLRQIEAVVKISKQKGEELTFTEVSGWSANKCSDYIGNHGNGGFYKNKETK